jgi:hypothetical protein
MKGISEEVNHRKDNSITPSQVIHHHKESTKVIFYLWSAREVFLSHSSQCFSLQIIKGE